MTITIFKQQMEDKKEQEMKNDIRIYLAKKDYYDILGIAKTASET